MLWVLLLLQVGIVALSAMIGYRMGQDRGYRDGWNRCKESHSYTGYGDYLTRRVLNSVTRRED